MSARSTSRWVVVKFGGTSVSSLANWRNIALVVKRRQESGHRVLVVHSAISKITDLLEKLLAAATGRQAGRAAQGHRGSPPPANYRAGTGREPAAAGLFRRAAGRWPMASRWCASLSDRTRARVMANGELMATEIGARFLKSQGIDATWMDAREMLTAENRGASAKASVLSATCSFAPDAALEQRLDAATPVVITQGFIARDDDGNTCLLGRGGSDTSASYLGAKIRARAIEIWTDVPGMFSANPRATPDRTTDPRAALRRSPGNRHQRRQGAASALPAAGAAVPDTFICVCHADAGPGRHADHRRIRAGRARQGDLQPQGHHADLARQSRHVAPGGLHGRRLRRVQGTRHVGGPGVDLRDQRDRFAGSGGQHARWRVAGQAAAGPVEALECARHRTLRHPSHWSAATSAPSCTSSETPSRCSKSRRCTWSARPRTI